MSNGHIANIYMDIVHVDVGDVSCHVVPQNHFIIGIHCIYHKISSSGTHQYSSQYLQCHYSQVVQIQLLLLFTVHDSGRNAII